ncbi:MAG: hypothetical protein ACK559_12790, partial [bacterium]
MASLLAPSAPEQGYQQHANSDDRQHGRRAGLVRVVFDQQDVVREVLHAGGEGALCEHQHGFENPVCVHHVDQRDEHDQGHQVRHRHI